MASVNDLLNMQMQGLLMQPPPSNLSLLSQALGQANNPNIPASGFQRVASIPGLLAQNMANNRKLQQQQITDFLSLQKSMLDNQRLEAQQQLQQRIMQMLDPNNMNTGQMNMNNLPVALALASGKPGVAAQVLQEQLKVQQEAETAKKTKSRELTAGELKADEKFASTIPAYIDGGGNAGLRENIITIQNLLSKLEKNPDKYIGTIKGIAAKSPGGEFIADEAKAFKQRYDSVIQQTLRQILGAAYTAQEGKDVLDRGYNPTLPLEENLDRLRTQLRVLKAQADSKNQSVKYFQENGTIKGLKLNTVTIPEENDPSNENQNTGRKATATLSNGTIIELD
ncbi:hypothetical protein [uncultured Mediterranean phage uvMED]|nr:hypothetical protein [uncultured Mediterranean phage uvMED]